jgi:hypothetical protein
MIPAAVTVAVTALQTQVAAALPLESASRPTIQALQLNAAALVDQIDAALAAAVALSASGSIGITAEIDTWVSPTDPEGIITGVTSMLVSTQTQWQLAVMRGIIGRVASNLDQLGPVPQLQPSKIYSPLPPAPKLPPPESGMSFLATFAKTNLKRFRFN